MDGFYYIYGSYNFRRLLTKKLFFIYVAKNEEWQQRQKEDWNYVYSMSRFYHWWIKHSYNIQFSVEADILPVITGKLFDRMSVSYLARDHSKRGNTIYHFYLAYFKPFWTDCNTEGYSSENFGMIHWKRPNDNTSTTESQRTKFFADKNCANVSHLLSHEALRMKGKKRKEYFEAVHELWDRHLYENLPYAYYNERFIKVAQESPYRFATVDVSKLPSL
jgi:hypothetical protein